MKLRNVRVSNFRSIENGSVNLENYTSFIGPNNSGKSSFIRAVEIFLNQITPAIEEFKDNGVEVLNVFGREVEVNKYHDITIEGVFKEIEEWERSCPGVSGIIHEDKIQLRVTIKSKYNAEAGKYSISKSYEAYVKKEIFEGLDFDGTLTGCSAEIQALIREHGFNGSTYKAKKNQEQIKNLIREHIPSAFQYGDWEWSADNFGIDPALKQAIPNAVVIPALKSIDEEMKSTQTSTFGKLLSKIIMPKVKASAHYTELTSSFSNLVAQLKSEQSIEGLRELRNDLTSRISEIIDARLILSLQEPEYDKVLGGIAELRLDDGKETPISLQGHGLQRSLIFCLLEIIAKHDSLGVDGGDGNINNRSVVLLYEEPELFIHPHLMRKLKKVLESISNSHSWQVAITTHSPYLVNVANNPRSLVVLKKESTQPPVIVQLESDPFIEDEKARLRAALDYHPTVCEAFFAKRSILVEGDTEVAMFSEAERLVNVFNVVGSLHSETTIVSCGGKWTISAIAKVMTSLGLPYKVIHDRDQKDIDLANLAEVSPIHPYKANAKIEQAVGNANNIYVVADTMEDVLWPGNRPAHKADKPFKAWGRLKEIMTEIEEDPLKISDYSTLGDIINFSYRP
jgi:predicted ATP-dependent endonuclease of OLD family